MIYLVTTNPSLIKENNLYTNISVERSLELLRKLSIIAVDTETSGIEVHTKDLLLAQFGCFDFQVVVDCRTINITLYKNLLEDTSKLFLFWNAKFDLKFFLKFGIVIQNIYDGFLAEKLLWLGYPSGFHSMSLKAAGEHYCNIELDKSVRGKIIWAKTLTDDIIEYGALDVKYLELIRDGQLKELKEKDLVTAASWENKFCPILAYTEFCGVKLDVERWKKKMDNDKAHFDSALSKLNNWVVDYYKNHNGTDCLWVEEVFTFKEETYGQITEHYPTGEWVLLEPAIKKEVQGNSNMAFNGILWQGKILRKFPWIKVDLQGDLWAGFDTEPKCIINWASPKQVTPFLEFLGFDLETYDKKTKEKKKSVGADIIKSQTHISSIASIYIEYKEWEKVVGTYGQNIIDQINPITGRIHTNFNQLGTDTGRLSSGGKDKENGVEYINLQNLPSDKETRACFVAEQGNKWISCDYSAQESRIIGELSQDKSILDLFNTGCGDMHSLVAKMAYPDIVGDCPVEEIKKRFHDARSNAKGVEFAINYGGNAQTIKSNKNIPLEEAEKIYDDYMKGFPGVKTYQDNQRKFVMDHGYILLNDKTRHKAFIYDYEDLMKIKAKFNGEYWNTYKEYKKSNPNSLIVEEVKHFFKRKSASEKQAINYKCQATGALMFKLASIYIYKYIVENNLLFKVKLCIPCHDEWNIEVPEEYVDTMTQVITESMKKAGAYFCKSIELPAEASVANYWIH